jgi:hypothetical protein
LKTHRDRRQWNINIRIQILKKLQQFNIGLEWYEKGVIKCFLFENILK